VRKLADEVRKLRTDVTAAARAEPGGFDKALQALEAKQQALGEVSRDYKDHLRAQTANLDDVGEVLIEFRQFRQVDFRAGKLGDRGLLYGASGKHHIAAGRHLSQTGSRHGRQEIRPAVVVFLGILPKQSPLDRVLKCVLQGPRPRVLARARKLR
jgi:hypothetical protein